LQGVGIEVKQILPCGVIKRHRHTDSAGTASTNSSRSHPNATREDKLTSSNTHHARSQFLESHLAKLFEQKMEIFTKVEYTQVSYLFRMKMPWFIYQRTSLSIPLSIKAISFPKKMDIV
jgi:vacuolar protein sorting-associated protein 51